MEQQNIIEKMLEKGDKIRHKYTDFDFETLHPNQLKMINHLTLFTKYKQRIINYFESRKISREVKVMFLDQNSMKMGDGVFYQLESAR
jgi:hypothetical protein